MKILYLLMDFPSVSETFVLNEICKMIDFGHEVFIVSLRKRDCNQIHKSIIDYNLLEKTIYLEEYNKVNKINKISALKYSLKLIKKIQPFDLYEKMKVSFLSYHFGGGLKTFYFNLLRNFKLLSILKEKNINHIHCHFAKDNLQLARKMNLITDIPYSFTTYAYDIYFSPEKNLKELASNAKKVITTSNYNKRYMINKFGISSNKINVVYSGIDLEKFKPIKVSREKIFTILNVGRLHPVKGHKYLIEACRILKEKNIKFQCWIVGDGTERSNLEIQINKYGLQDYVKLLGIKKNEELITLYNKADIFVLPSISESMGVVNMEALACRLPVIASKVRGVPELVFESANGFLVTPRKPEQIANRIIEFIQNKKLRTLLKNNSRNIVKERFEINKNARAVSNLLFGKKDDYYNSFYSTGGWKYDYQKEKEFLLTHLIKPINLINGAKIVEIGCGKGFHSNILSKLGFNVIGVDISKEGINYAKKTFNGPDFLAISAADIDKFVNPKSLDLILSRGMSWYHYELNGKNSKFIDVPKETKKLFSFLKKGGYFVLHIKTDFSGSKSQNQIYNNTLKDYMNLFKRFGEIVYLTDSDGRVFDKKKKNGGLKNGIFIITKKVN